MKTDWLDWVLAVGAFLVLSGVVFFGLVGVGLVLGIESAVLVWLFCLATGVGVVCPPAGEAMLNALWWVAFWSLMGASRSGR